MRGRTEPVGSDRGPSVRIACARIPARRHRRADRARVSLGGLDVLPIAPALWVMIVGMAEAPWVFGLRVHHQAALVSPSMLVAHLVARVAVPVDPWVPLVGIHRAVPMRGPPLSA